MCVSTKNGALEFSTGSSGSTGSTGNDARPTAQNHPSTRAGDQDDGSTQTPSNYYYSLVTNTITNYYLLFIVYYLLYPYCYYCNHYLLQLVALFTIYCYQLLLLLTITITLTTSTITTYFLLFTIIINVHIIIITTTMICTILTILYHGILYHTTFYRWILSKSCSLWKDILTYPAPQDKDTLTNPINIRIYVYHIRLYLTLLY